MAKPCATGLLGSRCHDRASSLACQTAQEKESGSMSFHDDHDEKDVSLLAIDQYLRWVSGIPAMSLEEEQRLLVCVEQGSHEQAKPQPDRQVLQTAKQARDRLLGPFQRLVMRLVRTDKYGLHRM